MYVQYKVICLANRRKHTNINQQGSTLSKLVASFYPALSERSPIPILYFPICFSFAISPFLVTTDKVRLSIFLTGPPLLLLCLSLPFYTFGDPSSDYYNSGPVLALLLWYIDFILCTPWRGDDAPAFHGRPGSDRSQRQSWIILRTISQRLRWASRLMIPAHRGIGWNWQVKGVPDDPYVKLKLSKWEFVARHLSWAVFYYLQSVAMLFILGWSSALRLRYSHVSSNAMSHTLLSTIVGWSGAIWVWDRLNCAYSAAAALSVSLGIFEIWEWPPLMGRLSAAWSVRQMWRCVTVYSASTIFFSFRYILSLTIDTSRCYIRACIYTHTHD